MRQMQRQATRRFYRGKCRLDISRDAEIVHMEMQRMRDLEVDHRTLQCLDDGARGDTIMRHHVVKREGPGIVLERRGATRIDAFDAKGAGANKHGADISGYCARALAVAQHG